MEDKKLLLEKELQTLEADMSSADFWANKDKAQATIKRIVELKAEIEGGSVYDRGDAIMTIFSGAGGDDAEDFSAMLLHMYMKYCENKNFSVGMVHQNENDHGGYRNVTIEISNPAFAKASARQGPYGTLKNESGVHRLVRISPFNANSKRQTSFCMVEVIPKFEKTHENQIELDEKDLKVELSRSSGPGGQNVNKRETAVRIVHIPSGLAAASDNERSQAQNKEKALQILKGKIFAAMEKERIAKEKGMYISKTTQIEWGNQIRSYVPHPYKMVKDHRTGVETAQVDKVLNEGEIEEFVEAEKRL